MLLKPETTRFLPENLSSHELSRLAIGISSCCQRHRTSPCTKRSGAPTASGRIKPTVSGYLFGSEHRTAVANTFEYFGCIARISYPLPSRAYGFLRLATMLPQTN